MRKLLPAAAAAVVLLPAVPADARKAYGPKWRVANVDVQGTYEWREHEIDDYSVHVTGETSYVGGTSSKTFTMKLSQPRPKVILAKPVRWGGFTTATYVNYQGDKAITYDCSFEQEASTAGLAGVGMVNPNRIRFQWSFASVGVKCPEHMHSLPADLPQAPAVTTRYPVRKFTGTRAVLPIDFTHTAGDGLMHYVKITWKGRIVIKRLKRG